MRKWEINILSKWANKKIYSQWHNKKLKKCENWKFNKINKRESKRTEDKKIKWVNENYSIRMWKTEKTRKMRKQRKWKKET